jgi:hypothetical protein
MVCLRVFPYIIHEKNLDRLKKNVSKKWFVCEKTIIALVYVVKTGEYLYQLDTE